MLSRIPILSQQQLRQNLEEEIVIYESEIYDVTLVEVDSSSSDKHDTNGLCLKPLGLWECNKIVHVKYVPKQHQFHIAVDQDNDLFLCHFRYQERHTSDECFENSDQNSDTTDVTYWPSTETVQFL